MGVGPKIRHLIAESCYNEIVGPALDCHMFRFTVNLGVSCPLFGTETICSHITTVFGLERLTLLNEIPASIAQLLHTRKHQSLKDLLFLCSGTHGFSDELGAYFFHYPPQKNGNDGNI